MDAKGNKPKTKVHKPGLSRNFPANPNYSQENTTRYVFARRDSTPELGVHGLPGLSFRREKKTLEPEFAEVPSYNLWKSRVDRRYSLPSCFTFQQRRNSPSSVLFVPSVITRESKGLRKYSTSLRGTTEGSYGQKTEEIVRDGGGSNAINKNTISVLPTEESWTQLLSREHSDVRHSPRSYCDSVSTIRCASAEIPIAKCDERQAYYAKNDRIKRWLSEVE